MTPEVAQELRGAIESDDTQKAAQFAKDCEDLDAGLFNWNMPPLAAARSVEMVDLLLTHGASVEGISRWWEPGFGAHEVRPPIAKYLLELGANISPHAAAAIGLTDELRGVLENTPALVIAPGGDGCHPLHFARTIETAKVLLAHGADIQAKDDDHDSTPAQWRIKDSPELVRFLLDSGATPDIFLAAALGDLDLVEDLVSKDPLSTSQRIGHNSGAFPGIGYKGRGGTIYQWTLGFNLSPHEVALKNGHQQVYDFLFAHTAPRHQLLIACTCANRSVAEGLAAADPTLVDQLDPDDYTLLAKFCWETNISFEAAHLMLDIGLPVDVPEINHGFMALHNAAWCGNPALVDLLLKHGHPTDRRDPEFNATAIGFAIHSCTQAKRHPDGKFHEVLRLLIDAGVPLDDHKPPVSDKEICALLQP